MIFTYDDCKPDGSKAALMGFVLADKARAWVTYVFVLCPPCLCGVISVVLLLPSCVSLPPSMCLPTLPRYPASVPARLVVFWGPP